MADDLGATEEQEYDDALEIRQIVENSAMNAKLSEEQKFDLYRKLEEFPCLWDTSKLSYKDKAQRQEATQQLCEMFNLVPEALKRLLHSTRTALAREIKKEQEGVISKSKWKFIDVLAFMKAEILQAAKVKGEKEWKDDENEIIIQFFKENEVMWNHKLPSYKDRNLKDYNYKMLNEKLPR